MYMTRMEIDTSKRESLMAIASPGMFHGAIESAFERGERKLWRIDSFKETLYLLIVSEKKPDLTRACEQFGTNAGWESRDYSAFLQNIREGDRFYFRLAANPTVSKCVKKDGRGKVMAHVTAKQQENWLLERSKKNGFSIGSEEFAAIKSEWVKFRKGHENGRPVSFRKVIFEGVLTVINVEQFKETLKCGIGREKAYGCGLLTIARKQS